MQKFKVNHLDQDNTKEYKQLAIKKKSHIIWVFKQASGHGAVHDDNKRNL